MDINDNNWQTIFINFVLIGIILLLLFRVIRYSLPLILRNPKQRDYIKRQLPVVETGFWFLFLSWFTFRFAQKLEVYAIVVAGLLFVLIFWFSKFYLRELIAGIIFKNNGRYEKGDTITANDHTGKILRFGLDMLEIEAFDGQVIFIPYSKLVGDSVHKRKEGTEKASGHTFKLETGFIANIAEFEEELQSFALTLPWISINKTVQVTLMQFENQKMIFNVTVYLLDRDFAINAESAIREQFETMPANKL